MPLVKGCSVESAKKNYKELLESGYPKDQAYAIALSNAQANANLCSLSRQMKLGKGKLFDD